MAGVDPILNKPIKAGDALSRTSGSAAWLEALRRAAIREVSGPGVIPHDRGWAVGRAQGAGPGVSDIAPEGFCEVQSVIGTSPPYIYTVQATTYEGGGVFGGPTGDDFDLWNLDEIGASGVGVHSLPVGTILQYWQDPASATYYGTHSFYRGTY